MAHNTINGEMISIIKKVNAIGVNVITDGTDPSAKCLTIIIDDNCPGIKQYEFPVVDDNGNSKNVPSPFTWVMDKSMFLTWSNIATKGMFKTINKVISEIVAEMPVGDFDLLRQIPNLESRMIEFFRYEMKQGNIPFKGFNNPALYHIAMIYGGIFHQHRGIKSLIEDLIKMVSLNKYIRNKCRTCMFHRFTNDGTGHRCGGISVDDFRIEGADAISMQVGANLFPDATVDRNGYLHSRYILGNIEKCDGYHRRF